MSCFSTRSRIRVIPEHARSLQAEHLFAVEHLLALATADQAAATTGRTETDALGLEHDNVETSLGEIQRGRQSREARTDDANVGAMLARELDRLPDFVRGGRVVAVGVGPQFNQRLTRSSSSFISARVCGISS